MKRKKVRQPHKTPKNYVLSATDLIGINLEAGLLKLRGGNFAGALHVHGMDLDGLHDGDKERVYSAWANAENSCEVSHKVVLCDIRPDLVEQEAHITYRLNGAQNEYIQQLLEREFRWVKTFQERQNDHEGYVLFFSDNQDELPAVMKGYASKLATGQIRSEQCDWRGLEKLCKALFQPTCEAEDRGNEK
jgi:hypothetical protein